MLAVLLLLFLVGEWTGPEDGTIDNVPMFAALCAALVLQPLIEWWTVRKYR